MGSGTVDAVCEAQQKHWSIVQAKEFHAKPALHNFSTARMSFAPILQLASLRTDPSQTKPEEPKSKLRWLVPSPPLIRIILVFVIPALLSTLAIQAGDVVASLAWLKYWIVLSFALLLELILEQLLQNKKKCAIPFTVVKVLFLLWLVAPITWNGSDTTHDYVIAPLVGLTKEGGIQTGLWVAATAPVVKDAIVTFGEGASLASYNFATLTVEAVGTAGGVTLEAVTTFGGLAFEGICTYGGLTLEAIYTFGGMVGEASCLAFSATMENSLVFLEFSIDGISTLASVTFNGIKDAVSSEVVFNTISVLKEVVISVVVGVQALLKASLSNGEQYRLLAGAINSIVGTNSNPRLFSDIVKSNVF